MSGLDTSLVILYFGVVALLSLKVGGHGQTTEDYLIGSRQVPWWAVLCSIIGTEISALTFVGVPALSYKSGGTDYRYLQLALGTILARLIVSRWFVPAFYAHKVVSIYEFLLHRFGPATRNLAACLFLFTRVLMSGVRLYAGALLVELALNVRIETAIVVVAVLGLAYTVMGGIQAVIYTEVLQVAVMFGGALTAVAVLLTHTGVPNVTPRILDFSLNPAEEFTLWAALLGVTFQNLAVFGTDYDMVQRMLTAENRQKSAKAVILSGLADVPIALLFLSIGTLLYAFYTPNLPPHKNVFPHFILTEMPPGTAGLVVAGVLSVILSTYESALTALAGSFIVDLVKPKTNPVLKTRLATVGFAVALTLVAMASRDVANILQFGLEIGAYTYGALLALFLTGLFTKRGNDVTCVLSVPVSILTVLAVKHYTPLGFTWFVLIGTLAGFAVAAAGRPRRA